MVPYRALHDFRGDATQSSITFQAGTQLLADLQKQQNGWIWVTFRQQPQVAGWCPISYVAPEASSSPVAATSSSSVPLASSVGFNTAGTSMASAPMTGFHRGTATNVQVTLHPDDSGEDCFGGVPMGGGWNEANDPDKGTYIPHNTVTPQQAAIPASSNSKNRSRPNVKSFTNGLRTAGSALSSSAAKAAKAAKTGVKATGKGIKNKAAK